MQVPHIEVLANAVWADVQTWGNANLIGQDELNDQWGDHY